MNVASPELCKELYERSGWDAPFPTLVHYLDVELWYKKLFQSDAHDVTTYCPAYDLGYLLRKLPAVLMATEENACVIDYGVGRLLIRATADTPEDAAAKLAIELFKQGILQRESA